MVPKKQHLRQLILKEAHESPLTIHPGSTKMYQDLRQRFSWTRMKREIAQYIANCDICRRVKVEHQRPAGTLQPLAIPEWKWDKISMDFITGFPRTKRGNNAIFVVIDRLSKVAHFLPVHESITASQLADLYISQIVSLHGVPLEINSDRGSLFTSRFWESFQNAMGMILKEAHESPLTIHPGSTKMYQDLRQRFSWTRMKREIAQYIANCDICRRVKVEHQRPAGTLQPLAIPEWKWDKISMDFITGFPRTKRGNNAIFVVIDRLSKVAHFLPVHESITASQLADLYISQIVSLHGVPLEINSDRGSLFTSRFWESFQNAMGIRLSFSTAFHPQSSGQDNSLARI